MASIGVAGAAKSLPATCGAKLCVLSRPVTMQKPRVLHVCMQKSRNASRRQTRRLLLLCCCCRSRLGFSGLVAEILEAWTLSELTDTIDLSPSTPTSLIWRAQEHRVLVLLQSHLLKVGGKS